TSGGDFPSATHLLRCLADDSFAAGDGGALATTSISATDPRFCVNGAVWPVRTSRRGRTGTLYRRSPGARGRRPDPPAHCAREFARRASRCAPLAARPRL